MNFEVWNIDLWEYLYKLQYLFLKFKTFPRDIACVG